MQKEIRCMIGYYEKGSRKGVTKRGQEEIRRIVRFLVMPRHVSEWLDLIGIMVKNKSCRGYGENCNAPYLFLEPSYTEWCKPRRSGYLSVIDAIKFTQEYLNKNPEKALKLDQNPLLFGEELENRELESLSFKTSSFEQKQNSTH
jgi:hypothetical protein